MSQAPTPQELQYMTEHTDDDRSQAMIISSVFGGVFAIIFVLMRILARRLPGIPFKADDWWMFASLAIYMGTPITFSLSIKYGAGRHVIHLTDPKGFSVVLLVCSLLYFINTFTIKVSLLCLYRRIFYSQGSFIKIVNASVGFLTAMTIASVLTTILQCIPLKKMWDPLAAGHCIDFGKFAMAMACVNIFTDVFLLVLPLPVVWNLHASTQKKWLITLSFVLGGSACVVCLVRLIFVLQVASTPNPTWDSVPSGITSTIELCIGIFAASFPTYRPLYKYVFDRDSALNTTRSKTYGYSNSNSNNNSNIRKSHSKYSSPESRGIFRMTNITQDVTKRDSDEQDLNPVLRATAS